jgi:hypothetical protein
LKRNHASIGSTGIETTVALRQNHCLIPRHARQAKISENRTTMAHSNGDRIIMQISYDRDFQNINSIQSDKIIGIVHTADERRAENHHEQNCASGTGLFGKKAQLFALCHRRITVVEGAIRGLSELQSLTN